MDELLILVDQVGRRQGFGNTGASAIEEGIALVGPLLLSGISDSETSGLHERQF